MSLCAVVMHQRHHFLALKNDEVRLCLIDYRLQANMLACFHLLHLRKCRSLNPEVKGFWRNYEALCSFHLQFVSDALNRGKGGCCNRNTARCRRSLCWSTGVSYSASHRESFPFKCSSNWFFPYQTQNVPPVAIKVHWQQEPDMRTLFRFLLLNGDIFKWKQRIIQVWTAGVMCLFWTKTGRQADTVHLRGQNIISPVV